MGNIERRMKELGVELPEKALVPRANAVAWKKSGAFVYVAGQGPAWNGVIEEKGRLGEGYELERAKMAAKLCALNLLFHLKDACAGDLDRVTSCVALTAYVRCTPEYGDMALVVNGASDLLVSLFGEAGTHTRTTVGVSGLALGMPVEISGIWTISD